RTSAPVAAPSSHRTFMRPNSASVSGGGLRGMWRYYRCRRSTTSPSFGRCCLTVRPSDADTTLVVTKRPLSEGWLPMQSQGDSILTLVFVAPWLVPWPGTPWVSSAPAGAAVVKAAEGVPTFKASPKRSGARGRTPVQRRTEPEPETPARQEPG